MFAVFVEVDSVDADDADRDAGLTILNKNVIPWIRDAGARAANWVTSTDGSGSMAFMVFDWGTRPERSRAA